MYPHQIWFHRKLGSLLRLYIQADQCNRGTFFLSSQRSLYSHRVIETLGSSVALPSHLTARATLSASVSVTPCGGSSITGFPVSVDSLACFIQKLDRNCRTLYCICCIATRAKSNCLSIHSYGATMNQMCLSYDLKPQPQVYDLCYISVQPWLNLCQDSALSNIFFFSMYKFFDDGMWEKNSFTGQINYNDRCQNFDYSKELYSQIRELRQQRIQRENYISNH